MYVRTHYAELDDGRTAVRGTKVFVPEDGPARDWVPTENVRQVDPPKRMHFINNLTCHKRATALIRGYVETRCGAKDEGEASACRGFLKAWHEIEADGNDMGIGLAVMRVDPFTVQFFFNIHGVGPCVWLPVLVTAANDHTNHILRETGPDRVAIAPDARGSVSQEEDRKRRIPPKVETVLVRGR